MIVLEVHGVRYEYSQKENVFRSSDGRVIEPLSDGGHISCDSWSYTEGSDADRIVRRLTDLFPEKVET